MARGCRSTGDGTLGLVTQRGRAMQISTIRWRRDKLRTVLNRDDRDEIAQLLRNGDANGDGWADVIDTLTMYPDVRRNVVRLLAEIDAGDQRASECSTCERDA